MLPRDLGGSLEILVVHLEISVVLLHDGSVFEELTDKQQVQVQIKSDSLLPYPKKC